MKLGKKSYYIIMSILVFVCFFYISYLTPLAGDDWGYALNGLKGNPLKMAIDFYRNWSGRFFSELYGFIVTPNKVIWNFLNPLLFVTIFVMINLIANPKSKLLLFVSCFFGMVYVSDNLRMETYSWLMGTTYVIPLALVLIYLYLVFKNMAKTHMSVTYLLVGIITNLYISLAMENIAAVLIFINICLLVYRIINCEYSVKVLVVLMVSVIGFVILRASPGAAYRLSLNTDYLNLSFLEIINSNLPSFFQYTFFDNKYLILLLNVVLIIKLINKETSGHLIVGLVVTISTSLMLLSNKFYAITNFALFNNINESVGLALIVFGIYISYLFFFINLSYQGEKRIKLNFFLLIAGASNLVMLYSPIFGSRSSIYFYFFALVFLLMLMDDIDNFKGIKILLVVIFLLSFWKVIKIKDKYELMNDYYQIKLSEITYYQQHQDETDIWLIRMPIYTVHSQDIEEGDSYHQEVFKQYFNLNPNATLHFYYKEN